MGKQISFYQNKKDEDEFLNRLNNDNIVLLKANSLEYPVPILYVFDNFPTEATAHTQLCICYESAVQSLQYEYIDEHDYYYINTTLSPTIEFDRCAYNPQNKLFISGRLWYQHSYWYENNQGVDILLKKDSKLELLYNRLASWIRRNYSKSKFGNYIASDVRSMLIEGAKLFEMM